MTQAQSIPPKDESSVITQSKPRWVWNTDVFHTVTIVITAILGLILFPTIHLCGDTVHSAWPVGLVSFALTTAIHRCLTTSTRNQKRIYQFNVFCFLLFICAGVALGQGVSRACRHVPQQTIADVLKNPEPVQWGDACYKIVKITGQQWRA